MLENYLDELLLEMRPAEEFLMAIPSQDRQAWAGLPPDLKGRITARADKWLDKDIPPLTASAFISYSRVGIATDYEMNRRQRRVMLRDLTMASCVCPDGRYDLKLSDVVWAILEESTWLMPANNPVTMGRKGLPLPDVYAPRVDVGVAETASDLSLCVQMASERLDAVSPQIVERVEREIGYRVIRPFLSLTDMAWMCGPKRASLTCLSGVVAGFLTFERNDRQRWQCTRKAWSLFDRLLGALPADGSCPGGLDEWLDVCGPVMDIAMMILSVTRGRVDIRREKMIRLMCHYPVFCHMGQGWFMNPGQRSMRPDLDGADMFRLGDYIDDDALCALGACQLRLFGQRDDQDRWLMHRAGNAFDHEALLMTPARPPYRRQGYFSHVQMMVARRDEDSEKGLSVAVHAGSNYSPDAHADTGDMALFCEGEPVLIDLGFSQETVFHNLPTIDGEGQGLGTVYGARDVICELEEDYAMMSMDLAKAYPASCGVLQWQRAVFFQRGEGVVQMIEIFELDAPREISFNFVTPFSPQLGGQWAQIGNVRMRWDGELTARADKLETPEAWRGIWGEAVYHLSLTPPEAMRQGKVAFSFNPLRSVGT